MSVEQDFLVFAGEAGANVLTQTEYAALSALLTGFQSGIAPSAALNKAWRQSSIMAAVLGQIIADITGQPVIDNGTISTIEENLATIFRGLGKLGVDSGTANAYIVTLAAPPAALYAGMDLLLMPLNTNTGVSTVNINGLGALPIQYANGTAIGAGAITAGTPVGLTLNSAKTAFIIGSNSTIPNATSNNQPVALGQQPLLATAYFHAQEQQPSAVGGGTNIVGVNIRVLNTILTNTISGASLASNQVTLPAGSYYVRASAPAFACGAVKLSLYNVSTSAYLLIGTAEITSNTSNSAKSFVSGVITLASTQALELSMYCTGGPQNGSGLGYPTGQPGIVEVYSDIEIWQLG